MNNAPGLPPFNARHVFYMPQQAPAPAASRDMEIEGIIDSYTTLAMDQEAATAAQDVTPAASAKKASKRRAERTPSPLPGLRIPEHKKRRGKRAAQPLSPPSPPSPSPAPQTQPQPLPTRHVSPYDVGGVPAVPHVAYALADMPPLQVRPVAAPIYVPLPRYGFIHELPQMMAPQTFTPMFMSPNGRFQYYAFADDDGVAKVALIGRVDEMQATYQDLACRHPGPAEYPFVPGPSR